MANQKISQMTYKQLETTDQFPTVNATAPTDNKYAFAGDIPVLIGILQWNSSTIYTANQIVIYNSNKVKGLFRVTTTTIAGDAPEGAGFDKFKLISCEWINNTFNANSITPAADIEGVRTGTITYTEPIVSGTSVLITLGGDWSSSSGKNLIVTSQSSPVTYGATESFNIEYFSTQINIYFTASSNYNANNFKIKFRLEG